MIGRITYLDGLLERLSELSIEVGVDDRVERGIEVSNPLLGEKENEFDLEFYSLINKRLF